MADYRRLLLLVLIMTGVAIIVGLTALAVFYDAAFERERQRLVNFAESQARLMLALGPAGLPQVLEDQRRLREKAAGQSAELQLARREGESIVFLTPARGSDQPRAPVTFRGPAAEPMTQALLGLSGTMIGRDYADRRVLAAFEPLPALGLGLVAKIDMAEINGRYLRAGLVTGFVSSAAVVGAALLFIQLGEPLIRRMRESESRYRALFENMDLGVAVYQSLAGGEDFAFRDFNRAAEQMSQLGREHVINKRLTEMFPGADEFGAIEVMRRVWQTSRPERLPTRYYRDGRIAGWRDVYVYKLPTGEIVTLFADVTARKEAERALSESEDRMRALLDASQDEILLLGIEGDVLAINKAAEHRLARRANGAHLIGARLDRLLSHDQAESRLARVREVAATRDALHCEVPVRSRWFDFWYYPVVLPDKPVTEVAVYAREITEQKKLLGDLSKLFQALQQSPMSVIITDREGTIEYVNPEFTKVTGYTTEEAIGQNPRILKSGRMPPELYEELWQTIAAGGVWRGELLNKKKNGELYWELASIGAVKEGEKLTNFVAVKEDITARRGMEDQLRQSQKMQVVGQLTGGIAHDFNNLLAIVIGNVQLLRERLGSDDAKAREFLDDALWSARRAGELTHRLLAFARKQPLKPSFIDLNDVVRGMSELLRRTLGAQIRIEESLAADVWKAVADRGELERVIVNLSVNSRDAMPTGGTLCLETCNALLDKVYCEQYEEVRPGEYVLLAVTDTGVGMSSEIVQRVFEPFFTTKEMGSGLGLSMVYGFVKQSGGHISIYSRVGYGTSVKIYLPRVPSSPDGWVDDPSDATAGDFGIHVVLDVTPKFYPGMSSFPAFGLPLWAG